MRIKPYFSLLLILSIFACNTAPKERVDEEKAKEQEEKTSPMTEVGGLL